MINILAVCSSAFYMNNCVSICELSPHVIGLQHIKHMRRQHLWFGNEYRCYREPCLLDATTLISSVQFLSHVQLFMTPWTAAHQASLSITNYQSLLKLISIESVMPSNHLILCRPLLPPSIFFSIRVGNESVLRIRWPKVLEFQLQDYSFQWIFRNDFLYDRLVGSPCSPRDSQESSLTPQFKSINYLVLSFLYGPTLTSIHNYWKNHSFD